MYLPKKKKVNWPITILYDDREKVRWKLKDERIIFERKRLLCGDYTIKGFENIVAIEKKSGLYELLTNLSGFYRQTFKRFLYKFSKYEIKILIIEDSLENIKTVLSKCRKTRLTEQTIYFWLAEIITKYKIPVLFIGKKKRVQDRMLLELFIHLAEETINVR